MIAPEVLASTRDLRARFTAATPFPYVTIDEFLRDDCARRLLAEFPAPNPGRLRNPYGAPGVKSVYSDLDALGESYRAAHAYFASRDFLGWLEAVTGIDGLLYDPGNYGGGTHENFDGRDLRPHVDFNYHPVTKLHRRLNVIVYLNEGWDPSWGGALALHTDPRDPFDTIVEFQPSFNRCVIFETSERSWHSFSRLAFPDDGTQRSRKSISIYLYTRERPAAETVAEHTTLFVPRPLPARYDAGFTLGDADGRELGELIGHRDRLIQLYQDQQSRREPDSEQAARLRILVADLRAHRPIPTMGYVANAVAVEGMYDDGWAAARLRLRIDVARTTTRVAVRARVPDAFSAGAHLAVAVRGTTIARTLASPGIVEAAGDLILEPGPHEIELSTTATVNLKAIGRGDDERDLGFFLECVTFEHEPPDGRGRSDEPLSVFHRTRFLRSVLRRLEHLATLDLPIDTRSVLEIGAGIGDLTSFFLDRNCTVTSVEPRPINVECFRERYAQDALWPAGRLRIVESDLDHLSEHGVEPHDVVFCYGLFNFLDDPENALRILAGYCNEMLVLEVAVNSGPGLRDDSIRIADADPADIGGSVSGRGCVPTRRWVFERLRRHFPHVYMTRTQPQFDRFRIDWTEPTSGRPQDRAIFVASRSSLENERLIEGIPDVQHRSP